MSGRRLAPATSAKLRRISIFIGLTMNQSCPLLIILTDPQEKAFPVVNSPTGWSVESSADGRRNSCNPQDLRGLESHVLRAKPTQGDDVCLHAERPGSSTAGPDAKRETGTLPAVGWSRWLACVGSPRHNQQKQSKRTEDCGRKDRTSETCVLNERHSPRCCAKQCCRRVVRDKARPKPLVKCCEGRNR